MDYSARRQTSAQVGADRQAAAGAAQQQISSWEETGLTMLAVAIVVAITALLLRKVMVGSASYEAASQSLL